MVMVVHFLLLLSTLIAAAAQARCQRKISPANPAACSAASNWDNERGWVGKVEIDLSDCLCTQARQDWETGLCYSHSGAHLLDITYNRTHNNRRTYSIEGFLAAQFLAEKSFDDSTIWTTSLDKRRRKEAKEPGTFFDYGDNRKALRWMLSENKFPQSKPCSPWKMIKLPEPLKIGSSMSVKPCTAETSRADAVSLGGRLQTAMNRGDRAGAANIALDQLKSIGDLPTGTAHLDVNFESYSEFTSKSGRLRRQQVHGLRYLRNSYFLQNKKPAPTLPNELEYNKMREAEMAEFKKMNLPTDSLRKLQFKPAQKAHQWCLNQSKKVAARISEMLCAGIPVEIAYDQSSTNHILSPEKNHYWYTSSWRPSNEMGGRNTHAAVVVGITQLPKTGEWYYVVRDSLSLTNTPTFIPINDGCQIMNMSALVLPGEPGYAEAWRPTPKNPGTAGPTPRSH